MALYYDVVDCLRKDVQTIDFLGLITVLEKNAYAIVLGLWADALHGSTRLKLTT